MANVVVLGLPGETGLWLADLDAGTVVPLEVTQGSPLAAANDLRNGGSAIVKGVNLAVKVGSTSSASAGVLDG